MEFLFELFQAALLASDDIMDKAELRRGQTCFYKLNGMKTLKNTFYMLSYLFKNFDKTCSKLYHKCLFITSLGQVLDVKEKNETNILHICILKYVILKLHTILYIFQ